MIVLVQSGLSAKKNPHFSAPRQNMKNPKGQLSSFKTEEQLWILRWWPKIWKFTLIKRNIFLTK